MSIVLSALVSLDATPSPSPTGALPRELDPTVVSPGLVGLAFFVALFVAVFFLMRSFVRQLRKIDIPGDDVDGDASPNAEGPPTSGESASAAPESAEG